MSDQTFRVRAPRSRLDYHPSDHFDNNDTGKDKLHRIASYLADRDFLVSANPNLTQEARNDQMTEWEAAAITDQNVLTREEASRAGRSWTSWLLGRNS